MMSAVNQTPSFKDEQMKHDRVFEAYKQKSASAFTKLKRIGVQKERLELFIRGFKFEEDLEVWAKNKDEDNYRLLTTYKFCENIGLLGPKRREGDKQIPEGVYTLSKFNPKSDFFLSLKVNYPNESDKLLSHPKYPGGLIFIHGGCETIGCVPITDEWIMELYVLCVEARNSGQKDIPIHLLPARLTDENYRLLTQQYDDKTLHHFWGQLKIGFDLFEQYKELPSVSIGPKGEYSFSLKK